MIQNRKDITTHPNPGMTVTLSLEAVPEFLLRAHACARSGRSEQALGYLTEARVEEIQAQTGAEALIVLGRTWRLLGDLRAAADCYERFTREQPSAAVLAELAGLYRDVGRFSQALQCCDRALLIQPDWPDLQALRAACLIKTGQLRAGIEIMKTLVQSGQATAAQHSQYLLYLLYLPDVDAQTLLHAHRAWGTAHAPRCLTWNRHGNPRDPQRRLKIGYLSADFRSHSVAYTFEALLDGRDTDSVEVYGYGSVGRPDEVTERLAGKFDHYRDIAACDDRAAARMIRADGIDILVTIGGHTTGHRMCVLAYKPAPLQVDFQSVVTTGISQIDYRFTDDLLDPCEQAAQDYVEQPLYVPRSVIAYTPPVDVPPVVGLPCLDKGFVTFGSFANHVKINDQVMALWSAVLQRVPGSCLLIKCPGGYDAGVVRHLTNGFADQGLAPERIQIRGWADRQTHWALYNQIDLALDTFPFNGCLATLEAAWMGVPTVSLVGDRYVSRMGKAILSHFGLGALAVTQSDEYIERAVALAQDRVLRARLRRHLRQAMWVSPLCDARRLARGLETAYRHIWVKWCQRAVEVEAPTG